MSKLKIKDATRILVQIRNGEWKSDARREWDHKPQSGKVYCLKRNGVNLWVANGLLFLRIESRDGTNRFIGIPFYIKVYLWFFGVGDFVASEIKAFNKLDAQKDYESLLKDMK